MKNKNDSHSPPLIRNQFSKNPNLIKVAELYPSNLDNYILCKERFPGCIYYAVVDSGNCLDLNNLLIPYFLIEKCDIQHKFPFKPNEINFFITNNKSTFDYLTTLEGPESLARSWL